MRTTQTLLATEKETPKEAELISHQYMLRAGLIRKLASGIYMWLPTGMRVIEKVKAIVRDEMNKADASEVLMPSVLPAELRQETARWDKFGEELLKFSDRHHRDFCYGPTHEEPMVELARMAIKSYKQLPLTFYQIQTKFRDEIRPRFGVMRAREFIMKDAYSFHENSVSLQKTYQAMHQAYGNILDRIGLEYRVVEADAGAIGGSVTHEFQVLAKAGEDIICYSDESDYAANIELATYLKPELKPRAKPTKSLEKVATPGLKTIKALCQAFNLSADQTVKTLIVKDADNQYFALVLRGDHTLNEVKVGNLPEVKAPFCFASNEEIQKVMQADPGSLGPINARVPVIADHSAAILNELNCGANESGFHFFSGHWERDVDDFIIRDIRNAEVGDLSPDGQGILKRRNGIEVGHIFQLGDHYSKVMDACILDEKGRKKPLIMGCYGFGISRVIAASIEQLHDDKGIIWPQEIAPYDVIILPMNRHKSKKVAEAAENIYAQLQGAGFDVLLDDRKERAGIMFADADLIGVPHQIIISDKTLEKNGVEYKCRKTLQKTEIHFELRSIIDKICHNS